MNVARYYPLSAECKMLCAGSDAASHLLGLQASLGHTVLDTLYASHKEADQASRSHPSFLTYCTEIERLQARHGDTAALPYRSAYDSPVFGFEAREDGVRLFVRHWTAAIRYPCGYDLSDILRTRTCHASRTTIPLIYGPSGPLKTLAFDADFKGADLVIKALRPTGALRVTSERCYLSYFPLKAPSPILERQDTGFMVRGYARTLAEVRAVTNTQAHRETVAISGLYDREADAKDEAASLLNPRWFSLTSQTDGQTQCVADVWVLSRQTASKRVALGNRRGGRAWHATPMTDRPGQVGRKGSTCGDSTRTGVGRASPQGDLGLRIGDKGHEPTTSTTHRI